MIALQLIQHLKEKFLLRQSIQIRRHCTDTVLTSSKMLDLKAKLLKIISVCIQDFLLLHVQGDNKWRCQILRIYGMLPELSDQTLIVDFFMRSMLIDDIKFILKLCQPVGVKHLTDHADAASGLRRE